MIAIPPAVLKWRFLADKYAGIHTVLRPAEILAVIWGESGGNPNAINPSDPSWGLMQVTMLIGKAFAGIETHEQLLDPDTNVEAGAGFLAHLKTKYAASFPLTDVNCGWIAGYNFGENNLRKRVPNPKYIANFISHLEALDAIEPLVRA